METAVMRSDWDVPHLFPIMTQLRAIMKLKLGFSRQNLNHLDWKGPFLDSFMRPRQVASVYVRHSLEAKFLHCFSA